MLYSHVIHNTSACRIKTTTQYRRATQFSRKKYTSHFIWKCCVWEEVGDRTELQHIDPHSIRHNHVSVPFSWAAQPETWGPSLSGTCSSIQHLLSNSSDPQLQLLNRGPEGLPCWVLAFSTASCLQLIWSLNWLNFLCTELYNSSMPTFFLWASQFRAHSTCLRSKS